MKILDSGKRKKFITGAVRDVAEGKGRCDLLPLAIIGKFFKIADFYWIERYIRTGDISYLYKIVDGFVEEQYGDYSTAILELAKHFEDGAAKYEERNWEKGMPLHRYIDSGVRHLLKHLRGDKDEPHDRAYLWNILCAIWTHENKPEMIDLPFNRKESEE